MPCTKVLTMTEAVTDTFTPLHTAVYVSSTDKILGTMENYICEFNATTGAFIRAVKAISPMLGQMHLGLVAGLPYVACNADRSVQSTTTAHHVRDDIFPVNTTTLVAGVGLGIPTNGMFAAGYYWSMGPRQFLELGTRVYFLYPMNNYVAVGYIGKANPADYGFDQASSGFWCEQICTDGTNIYTADPGSPRIQYYDAALNLGDYSDTPTYYPVAVEWATVLSKVFAVCGSQYLVRVDNFPTSANTYIDLEGLIAPVTGIKPVRLRYRSTDSKLYIPVQNKDGIVVYDPVGGTAVWKSGFASPVDVVFTGSKAFAVQSSEAGLKEIT